MKFEKIAGDWLKFKKSSVKPSTYSTYSLIIQTRILNSFEEKTIKQLMKYNFNEYVESYCIFNSFTKYTKMRFRCRIKHEINKYTKVKRKGNDNI